MTQEFIGPVGHRISIGETRSRGSAHAHKIIASVAREAANELYDELMRDNGLRAAWKAKYRGYSEKRLRAVFVARNWGKCLPLARATLARLLVTSPDEALKESVYEALCLDATLMRGRGHA